MNLTSQKSYWFFPIEEAPVFVTVTRDGNTHDARLPRKKILVASDTGDIGGIVEAGYKVFTNHRLHYESFPRDRVVAIDTDFFAANFAPSGFSLGSYPQF